MEQNFPEVILNRRLELELKQKYVANFIGLSAVILSRMENDDYPAPKKSIVLKLAEVLQLDSDSLLLSASLQAKSLADFNKNYPILSSFLCTIDIIMNPKGQLNIFQQLENTLRVFANRRIPLCMNIICFLNGSLGFDKTPKNGLPSLRSIFSHIKSQGEWFTDFTEEFCSIAELKLHYVTYLNKAKLLKDAIDKKRTVTRIGTEMNERINEKLIKERDELRNEIDKLRALSCGKNPDAPQRSEESSGTQPASSDPSVNTRKPMTKGENDSST